MNAIQFIHAADSHADYLKIAYGFLINAYRNLMQNNYDASSNDENTIRNDLVRIAENQKHQILCFRWITELPDINKKNRIDIELDTPYSLRDERMGIKIECKIVGEDKYIDTKVSFNRMSNPTNGIMSFISGKYSSEMPLAGMLGFIKQGDINKKIEKIKERLDRHKDITTLQNLTPLTIKVDFDFSFNSRHKRNNPLSEIEIYHLFFDFT